MRIILHYYKDIGMDEQLLAVRLAAAARYKAAKWADNDAEEGRKRKRKKTTPKRSSRENLVTCSSFPS